MADEFLRGLSDVKPLTDNPASLMHNYMARKPYNIVSEIIENYTNPGDVVYDPMAGSGTSLIEASKLGRTAIGADVNPVACNIMRCSLQAWDVPAATSLLTGFVDELRPLLEEAYGVTVYGKKCLIERCHFSWNDGKLEPKEFWFKEILAPGKLSGRKKANCNEDIVRSLNKFREYEPFFIDDKLLIPNSRIAVPDGRSVYDLFCPRNLAFFDKCIGSLLSHQGEKGYELLQLLVSSATNLIKLSDKKASSQIPYWIPRKNVTSRNAFFVLEKKAKAIVKGLGYLEASRVNSLVSTYEDARGGKGCIVCQEGAQSIGRDVLPNESVDLVLTDPPYTDQVPYVEYAQLTADILGWDLDDSLGQEMVVSDAPSRGKSEDSFNNLMREILVRTSASLKTDAYLVMFYHSFDIRSWSSIISLMAEAGLVYVDQAPLRTPRKSFKTVMSPGRTLNGNYIVVFKKSSRPATQKEWTLEEAIRRMRSIVTGLHEDFGAETAQDYYDNGLLRDAIEQGYLGIVAKSCSNFDKLPIGISNN